MQQSITVNIFSLNCINQGTNSVISVNGNNLQLAPYDASNPFQQWMLIPNLVQGASQGGYTLYNVGQGSCADQPVSGQPISLNDDPTPYGAAPYCWMFWSAGQFNNETAWAIQSNDRSAAMDAQGGACDNNTPVLFYNWNGGQNQQWVIRQVQ